MTLKWNIEIEWVDKVPFSNKNTSRRRELIYSSIDLHLSFYQVNAVLLSNKEKEMSEQEFLIWEQYLHPIAKSDEFLYRDIVEFGAQLPDVGHALRERLKKTSLS